MVTNAHDIGDSRRLQVTFTDVADAVADPTTIALNIKAPDGTLTTKAIGDLTKVSTGIFYYDHTFTSAGRHVINWTAAGAVITAAESEIYIRKQGGV